MDESISHQKEGSLPGNRRAITPCWVTVQEGGGWVRAGEQGEGRLAPRVARCQYNALHNPRYSPPLSMSTLPDLPPTEPGGGVSEWWWTLWLLKMVPHLDTPTAHSRTIRVT